MTRPPRSTDDIDTATCLALSEHLDRVEETTVTDPVEAGRTLDAEIALKVFGVKRLYGHDGKPWNGKNEFPQYIPSGRPWRTHSIDATTLPWFSSDIGAAWLVVERIQALLFWHSVELHADSMPDGRLGWCCGFDVEEACAGAFAATAPLAICRAALSALRATAPASTAGGMGE